jgi:hypothetical protein
MQPPAPAAKLESQPVGERRAGRPFDVAENARRVAVLARVELEELTDAEAAAQLGITPAAWSSWKSYDLRCIEL